MDRNHIHTTWDATYHPFEETLATGDCDFLSRLICEALADGDDTLLTKWGDIGVSADVKQEFIVLSIDPKEYQRSIFYEAQPTLEHLHHDIALFLAVLDMEGYVTIEPVTTVMTQKKGGGHGEA